MTLSDQFPRNKADERDTEALTKMDDYSFLNKVTGRSSDMMDGYKKKNELGLILNEYNNFSLSGKHKVTHSSPQYKTATYHLEKISDTLTIYDFEQREITKMVITTEKIFNPGRQTMEDTPSPATVQTRAFHEVGNLLTLDKAYEALIKLGGLEIDWQSTPRRVHDIYRKDKVDLPLAEAMANHPKRKP